MIIPLLAAAIFRVSTRQEKLGEYRYEFPITAPGKIHHLGPGSGLTFGSWCAFEFVDYPASIDTGDHFDSVTTREAANGVDRIRKMLDTKEALAALDQCMPNAPSRITRWDEAMACVFVADTDYEQWWWAEAKSSTISAALAVLRLRSQWKPGSGPPSLDCGMSRIVLAERDPSLSNRIALLGPVARNPNRDCPYIGLSACIAMCRYDVALGHSAEAAKTARAGLMDYRGLRGFMNYWLLSKIAKDPERTVRRKLLTLPMPDDTGHSPTTGISHTPPPFWVSSASDRGVLL